MSTYLLIWNPKLFVWKELKENIRELKQNGVYKYGWSTGSTKRIHPGDRVFLMRLGVEPKGLVGSGWVTSEVEDWPHWDDPQKMILVVDIDWDTLLDAQDEAIFPVEALRGGVYDHVKKWLPQASGMSIPDIVAEQLELDWASFLNQNAPVRQITYPDEIDTEKTYFEGAAKQVIVNIYERNAEARAICIKEHGANCSVCGFNFAEKFGDIGSGYIHVHHRKPLSEIHESYKLNPTIDLIPVCPNCHAMLHQRKPEPYTIDELIAILNQTAMLATQPAKPTFVAASPKPAAEKLSESKPSDYGLYKCGECRSYVLGHDKESHVKAKHKDKDVEWSKMGS